MKRFFNVYGPVWLTAVALVACQVTPRATPPTAEPARTAAVVATASPFALASLTPMPTATPTPTPPPTTTPTTVIEPTAEPTSDRYFVDTTGWRFSFGEPSDGVCPEPTDATRLLHNERAGYCLLYPDSHMVLRRNHETDPTAVSLVVDTIMNTSDPYAFIRTWPADGRTIEDLAAREIDRGWEIGVNLFPIDVGGYSGYLATGMPGQDLMRTAWLVAEDHLYSFAFAPDDYAASDTNDHLSRFIEVVLDNFTPLAPTESDRTLAGCLLPRADEQLIIDETLGICLLLSAGYTQENLSANEIVLRPDASDATGSLMLSIKVSDEEPHMTAERAARALAGLYPDEATRTSCCLALDSENAYVVEGEPSVELGRIYLATYRGRLYTVGLSPWDPTRPGHDAATALDHLVRTSFRFLPSPDQGGQ